MILWVICWRWLGLLFGVLNVFDLPPCARRRTLQPGTGCSVSELRPCLLPRMGWSSYVSCGSSDSSLCSEHSALRLATSLSRCFSANLWHQVLNWNFLALAAVAENRASTQTCTDSLACRGLQQFPANLFVLYCTHQVPVSHPHPFHL